MDMLRFQLTSRQEFERLMATPPETLTDLERAARFLYLQRLAFGGKVAGRNFGLSHHTPGRFDVSKLGPLLADLNERLSGVIIENLPYADFISRYDAEGVLFYLDPPYFGSEADYGHGLFVRSDFARLAGLLEELKGLFVLSINDTPEIRDIFTRFDLKPVEVSYTIHDGAPKQARELIITPSGLPLRPELQAGLFDG
jgi:DNA adenine methylase